MQCGTLLIILFDLDSIEGEILLWIFVFEVRYHTNGMSRIMELY